MSRSIIQPDLAASPRRGFRAPTATIAASLAGAIVAVTATLARADLPAPPPLPTFAAITYNVTVSNPLINGGVPASTASSDNTTAVQAYINYANSHGGGHVEIPAGTFLSNTLTLKSNVDLQIDSGAILRLTNVANKLITASSGSSNMQISGSGIIDGAATTATGSNNLIDIRNVNTLAILGVQIQNAAHEHLVPIGDNNVTISGVTISDPGTLAANGGNYLSNTDAIDYAGNNFLITNCSINCGDDDIVAKPAGNAVSNIVITGCTIGAGHGISVGGGVAQGVTNLIVTNCTFNGTSYGLRMKAQDASGGSAGGGTAHPLKNVVYKDITMTNVSTPIAIESFYQHNGASGDVFADTPTDTAFYPSPPPAVDGTTPFWENIAYENITATGGNYSVRVNGLNTTPSNLDGVAFSNVNISANKHTEFWYGTNIDVSGLSISVPQSDPYANASPVKGAYLYGLTNLTSGAPPLVIGDFDRDGQFTVADIAAMQNVLTDLSGFQSTHSFTDIQMAVLGDFNYDFKVTNTDLQGLINLIASGGGGSVSVVPEPSSVWLIGMAGLALCGFRSPLARRFATERLR
jgi:polygalacturonase